MAAEAPRAGRQWRARVALVGLFALFLFPIIGAFILNVVAPHWFPFGQVNRGELVDPAVPARLDTIQPVDGGPVGPKDPEAVWTLVYLGPATCNQRCEEALVSMRQARLALGKDAGRVDRWWLLTEPPQPGTVRRAHVFDPGLRVGTVAQDSVLSDDAPLQVVDPSGYLILRYSDTDAANLLLKDLKRLLKISTQG